MLASAAILPASAIDFTVDGIKYTTTSDTEVAGISKMEFEDVRNSVVGSSVSVMTMTDRAIFATHSAGVYILTVSGRSYKLRL